MFLVLTPCLYCNVSDSWMLPSKWHRAMIGAGGMYVEIAIASICTLVWWYTQPGLLHNLCSEHDVRLLGEHRDLQRQSAAALRRLLHPLGPDRDSQPEPEVARPFWAAPWPRSAWAWIWPTTRSCRAAIASCSAIYAVAAAAYRWVVVFSILFFLNEFFKPYRLQIVGEMMGMMSLFGLIGQPLWKLGQFFYVPGRLDQIEKTRAWITLAGVFLLLTFLFYVPLPHRIFGTLELEPHDAQSVFVDVPGQLDAVFVQPGQHVEKARPLARLSNLDLSLKIAELTTRRDQLISQLSALRRSKFDDRTAGLQIPEVKKSLEAVEEQLASKQQDIERLNLVAGKAGIVLPPPEVPPRPEGEAEKSGELASWSGLPFDNKNQGAWLTEGTLFCQVGDAHSMQASVVVEQGDIEFLRKSQVVDIKLDELPLHHAAEPNPGDR